VAPLFRSSGVMSQYVYMSIYRPTFRLSPCKILIFMSSGAVILGVRYVGLVTIFYCDVTRLSGNCILLAKFQVLKRCCLSTP
jgi:hypothetical protein